MESPTDIVTYRSQLNSKINRNFEVFTPTDFLAAITQQCWKCEVRSASVEARLPKTVSQAPSLSEFQTS